MSKDTEKTATSEGEGKVTTLEALTDVKPIQEQFEQRWHQIRDGIAYPKIQSFPGIHFNSITRLEKTIGDRIYDEKLMELKTEDKQLRTDGKPGLLDELDIELQLRDWAKERGWNLQQIREMHNLYVRRIKGTTPFQLTRTSLETFSPEEFADMTPETRARFEQEEARLAAERAQWVQENTSDKEREIREQIYMIQLKAQEYERYCIQTMAGTYRSVCALMMNACNDGGTPYFQLSPDQSVPDKTNTMVYRNYIRALADLWEILPLPERDVDLLHRKWIEWEDGRELDFLFP